MIIIVREDTESTGILVTTQPLSVIGDYGNALQGLSGDMQARVYTSPVRIYLHSNRGVPTLIQQSRHALSEAARRIGFTDGVRVVYAQP